MWWVVTQGRDYCGELEHVYSSHWSQFTQFPHSWDRLKFLFNFPSWAYVARQSPDSVALCPKTESLTPTRFSELSVYTSAPRKAGCGTRLILMWVIPNAYAWAKILFPRRQRGLQAEYWQTERFGEFFITVEFSWIYVFGTDPLMGYMDHSTNVSNPFRKEHFISHFILMHLYP